MHIHYRFRLADGHDKRFELRLQPRTLDLVPRREGPPPDWTRLDNHQCGNCPLSADKHPHCPIAVNLVEVIEEFHEHISYEQADTTIRTDEREYRKRAPLQASISSLIGVVMVTSGCPVMDKLRPMVRSHLPFASADETVYRALSMYLLAQYFRSRRGLPADWALKDLVAIYEAVGVVNADFVKRLGTIGIRDASINALVSLTCFGTITAESIVEQAMGEVEALFGPYLR